MSGFHYKASSSSTPRDELNWSPPLAPQTTQSPPYYENLMPPLPDALRDSLYRVEPLDISQLPLPDDSFFLQPTLHQSWASPSIPAATFSCSQTPGDRYVEYPAAFDLQSAAVAGPSMMHFDYTLPVEPPNRRVARAGSLASEASSTQSCMLSEASRGASPSANEMSRWGRRNSVGSWSCAYPGCSSSSTFTRGCDLRKHYKRHSKTLFCRHDGCPNSIEGGFSSKKDRSRHEAKHNPGIRCEWDGCERLFSRQDNMKDHVKRVHRRRAS